MSYPIAAKQAAYFRPYFPYRLRSSRRPGAKRGPVAHSLSLQHFLNLFVLRRCAVAGSARVSRRGVGCVSLSSAARGVTRARGLASSPSRTGMARSAEPSCPPPCARGRHLLARLRPAPQVCSRPAPRSMAPSARLLLSSGVLSSSARSSGTGCTCARRPTVRAAAAGQAGVSSARCESALSEHRVASALQASLVCCSSDQIVAAVRLHY